MYMHRSYGRFPQTKQSGKKPRIIGIKESMLTISPYAQKGQTSGLRNATTAYAAQAIYKLILKPTNSLVNLVVANQTFVDNASGVSLRTVELSIVRVFQPACYSAVRIHLHNLQLLL